METGSERDLSACGEEHDLPLPMVIGPSLFDILRLSRAQPRSILRASPAPGAISQVEAAGLRPQPQNVECPTAECRRKRSRPDASRPSPLLPRKARGKNQCGVSRLATLAQRVGSRPTTEVIVPALLSESRSYRGSVRDSNFVIPWVIGYFGIRHFRPVTPQRIGSSIDQG